jgi:endoglucanase
MFVMRLFLVALVLLSIVSAYAQRTLPRVRVEGNRFVVNDSMIVFRGLNASDPEKLERDGHWNQEYFNVIKNWGANLVRFPVHPAAWRRQGKEAYFGLLDRGVQYAEKAGLYVVIDWHSIGNLCTEKFQAAMYETTRAETSEFWNIVSRRYRDNTVVAFFEFFNEPTIMGGKLGECSWQDWKKINEELIAIVRKNEASAIPLVAGFNWAYDLTPVAKDPVDATGIAYVSHPYPMKRQKPWEDKWTADWGFVAEKYPLILTEIGFCGEGERGAHVPVISDETYGESITNYTRQKNISYVVWVFDPQWAPMLIEDWNFTPTRQGRYFKAALGKK